MQCLECGELRVWEDISTRQALAELREFRARHAACAVQRKAIAGLAAATLLCRVLGIPLRREADLPAGPARPRLALPLGAVRCRIGSAPRANSRPRRG